ncbi:MAG: hypothetical protein ACFE9Q_16250 [Candidatus Hodarchaeota archaeon]
MSVEIEDDIYRKLQKYLDSLPVDYPETESGVEIMVKLKGVNENLRKKKFFF